ncbi:PREDICTED: membrane cofactor protein-like [Poecilia mexicana]|uniref:Sushi domain-containing protein n=1 Tax=Poecilia mexicana TaxID=48701 RepID=A0A3B3WMB0_9TELE|nr:PREDICTED: membrane cofactor protein-like [Poecilia formosa]XP_014847010.1 PREDICTED: membrane cofactor protein-like [Poecilia mexicana]
MSVSALFLLSSLCLVITAQGQQCSKPVGRQNMQLKDEYINKKTFEDGSTVAFVCDVGYTPVQDSGVIRCNAGIWSPLQLICERSNCGSLGEVPNGQVSYPQGTQFGDKALITCNTGYKLVGKSEITCGTQGWLDRLPTCEVAKCLQPSGIANGMFSPQKEDYTYREVVEYSCNKDYTLNGSKQITCEENNTFKPSPPSCIWVECKDPVIPNAVYIDGSRPPHRHKATVIYNCKHGYKMNGQGTLTCNISSQWYPRIPECISNGNAVVGGSLGGLVSITVMLVQNYWM